MFQAAAIVGYAQAAMEFVVGGVANTYQAWFDGLWAAGQLYSLPSCKAA